MKCQEWIGVELGDPVDRACNDNGDGGVCTHCGRLHTVTVYDSCRFCLRAETPEHVCTEEDCAEVARALWARRGVT